jgi:hypothetical protein
MPNGRGPVKSSLPDFAAATGRGRQAYHSLTVAARTKDGTEHIIRIGDPASLT